MIGQSRLTALLGLAYGYAMVADRIKLALSIGHAGSKLGQVALPETFSATLKSLFDQLWILFLQFQYLLLMPFSSHPISIGASLAHLAQGLPIDIELRSALCTYFHLSPMQLLQFRLYHVLV